MEWLNYHHLLYFWMVLRRGSVRAAAEELHLAPTTVGAQIHRLEEALGERLLSRTGRRLVPTEMGTMVFRYADEIFSLGRELQDTVRGRPTGRPLQLVVGAADVLPKQISHWLIAPALALRDPVKILCREAPFEQLLPRLAMQEFDVVLSDAPIPPAAKVRAYNHLLGETGVAFLGVPRHARKLRDGFPRSLDGAPLLLPTDNAAIRRSLDEWFAALGIHPEVVGQFEDDALMREFGSSGLGIFPTPTAQRPRLLGGHGLEVVGTTNQVRGRFYAISLERRIQHPAVVAICETAQRHLRPVLRPLARRAR